MQFRVEIQDKDSEQIEVRFQGDFVAELESEVLGKLTQGSFRSCRFSFEKVTRLNSLGTRSLASCVQQLQARKVALSFSHCVPEVVDQINLLPALRKGVAIESLFIDEQCPDDHGPFRRLLNVKGDISLGKSGRFVISPAVCPVCGEALESEQLLDVHLAFLKEPESS